VRSFQGNAEWHRKCALGRTSPSLIVVRLLPPRPISSGPIPHRLESDSTLFTNFRHFDKDLLVQCLPKNQYRITGRCWKRGDTLKMLHVRNREPVNTSSIRDDRIAKCRWIKSSQATYDKEFAAAGLSLTEIEGQCTHFRITRSMGNFEIN
jgi:hypothetical protein